MKMKPFSYSLLSCHGNEEQQTAVWFLPGLSCMSYEAHALEDEQGGLKGHCIGISALYFLHLLVLQSPSNHQELLSSSYCHYEREKLSLMYLWSYIRKCLRIVNDWNEFVGMCQALYTKLTYIFAFLNTVNSLVMFLENTVFR
jgi:hypothetical protein